MQVSPNFLNSPTIPPNSLEIPRISSNFPEFALFAQVSLEDYDFQFGDVREGVVK